ncbi:ArsC/Spx/MgsR family protein [Magnetovibrio sp. PR-2]|uniref:ArsC/Spx/MgsR family protein n=1 Tax=Magnetovibrio sp. PR-2 TaxID=3120356 RepID=UPI002FCE2A29
MRVEFYEKPGCKGNAKQRARLAELGYTLDVKDMLSEPWTADTLRPFFGSQPVTDWFNQSAVKVKKGIIDPASFDENGALETLMAEPMLIRRPLMRTEKGSAAGFQPGPILAAIGIDIPSDETITEGCQRAPGEKHSCQPPKSGA